MSWLTEIVRPKIKKTTPKEIADNLWVRCPNCNQMLFSKELKDSHYVCTACGHHLRLYVEKRFKLLFDDEKFIFSGRFSPVTWIFSSLLFLMLRSPAEKSISILSIVAASKVSLFE